MENKTIIGSDGYLFLSTEVQLQKQETPPDTIKHFEFKYLPYLYKTLLIVFPSKCCICHNFLQDSEISTILERKKLTAASNIFDDHFVYDNTIFDSTDYYKTDSHMNLKGCLKVFNLFVSQFSNFFFTLPSLDLSGLQSKTVTSLSVLGQAIGDLTWPSNLGNQNLQTQEDVYYSIPSCEQIYMVKKVNKNDKLRILSYELVDETEQFDNQVIEWSNIISPKILFQRNENCNTARVVIFYDSFLLSTLHLYLNLFHEVYLIKNVFSSQLIDNINPHFVFEFRTERFLLI